MIIYSNRNVKVAFAKASATEGTLCFIRKFEANSGLRPCSGAKALAQAPEAHGVRSPPTLKLRWAKAETKGFEPLIRFPVYTLSRRASSTTRAGLQFHLPLKLRWGAKIRN